MDDLDAGKPLPTLLFSITAHERFDILFDQVLNISVMCPGSVIVVHVSESLRASVEEGMVDPFYLDRVREVANVHVNPRSLPTHWAHMFHAHVANFDFIEREEIAFDYLVLASSADLVVRSDFAEYVSHWDMGVNEDDDPQWPWRPFAEADPVVRQLVRQAGRSGIVHAAHEGSFYSRALARSLFATLREHVGDWEYREYPKEEVFLPTLAMSYQAMLKTRSVSYVLGWSAANDRSALRQIFTNVGLATGPAVTPLRCWIEAELPRQDAAPFMVSRIPRDRAHPLRLLLGDMTPAGISDRARFLAARLTTPDIEHFDINYRSAGRQPSIVRRGFKRVLKRLTV